MTEQTRESSTNEGLQELKLLGGEVKRLGATSFVSLLASGIAAAAALMVPALLGAFLVLGTSGLGVAAVVVSHRVLASKITRGLALATALRNEGALSEEDFAGYMRSLKNAGEGSPVTT